MNASQKAPLKLWERCFDAVLISVAALVCLLFTAQLFDTRFARAPKLAPSAVVLNGSGSLIVRTIDAEGRGFAGAVVRLFFVAPSGAVSFAGERWGETDKGVRFDQVPEGELWVVAYGEGKARATARVTLGLEEKSVTLQLLEAHTLDVKVVDDEGKPLAFAEIEARGSETVAHRLTTDEQGLAHFDRLLAPPWSVSAGGDGFEPASKVGVYPEQEPLLFKLERLGGFEIHVVDVDGEPAAMADVMISGPGLWPARMTHTDEQGNVVINGLYGGIYDLKAKLDDKVSATAMSVLLPKGTTVEQTLKLEEGRYVVVTVTDGPMRADGVDPRPVEDAGVLVVEDGLSAFPLEARTGKLGVAIVGPLSGSELTVSARAQGFVPRTATPEDVLDDRITIPLLRGGTILGEVRDARGFPVDGATIEVFGTDLDGMPIHETSDRSSFGEDLFTFSLQGPVPLLPRGELGVMPGPVPPIPHASSTLINDEPSSVLAPWVSDGFGEFKATPVTPGRVQVLVRHPEYTEYLSDVLSIESGGEVRLKVVLKPGGFLEGRVVEEDRFAVVGARIEIAALAGTHQELTYTNDDGVFSAAGLPEMVLVTVYRGDSLGEVAARLEVAIEPEQRKRIEITLPRVRESSTFRFVDAFGAPVSRAEVRVQSLDLQTVLVRTLFTDEDGSVEVPNARGLPLRLVVERPSFATYFDTLQAAEAKHQFTLQPGRTLRGYVTAREGRVKVEGAAITLYTLGSVYHLVSDEEGLFEQGDLAVGRIRIVVRHEEYAKSELVVAFEGDASRPIELETIDLLPAGTVEGTVIDEAGNSIVGARVGLDAVPTYLPPGRLPLELAQTDADGRFTLKGLPERLCELEAYSPELGRGRIKDVDVRAGRITRRVTIVIPTQEYAPRKILTAGSVALTLAERAGKVVILNVPDGGQAELAGMEPQDQLLTIGAKPIDSIETARDKLSGPLSEDTIVELLRPMPSGEPIPITLRVRRESVRR